jgi:glycosyltransferase involved in cell wall biosynthesis
MIADWYAPGYKAGGLITALSNLVDFVGDTFSVYVITRDRDLNDENPYPKIQKVEWQKVGNASVCYTADLSIRYLRKRIAEVVPDIIYLNSFFSPLAIKILCLRKLGLLHDCAFVLAPRGELSPGALEIKQLKKTMYRNCALCAGLYNNLLWHATSELEKKQISAMLDDFPQSESSIVVAWDLPSRNWLNATKEDRKRIKTSRVRILFISRISPKKNLLFALEALRTLSGGVEFDIFGPVDDKQYWEVCRKQIDSQPSNVIVRYRGAIPRESIPSVAVEYDFFLLPTRGENFGYVILEAMAAGCPVILSDQTPWGAVTEKQIGWCIPLDDHQTWHRVLQQCVDMDPHSCAQMSSRARTFAESWALCTIRGDESIHLFKMALRSEESQDV